MEKIKEMVSELVKIPNELSSELETETFEQKFKRRYTKEWLEDALNIKITDEEFDYYVEDTLEGMLDSTTIDAFFKLNISQMLELKGEVEHYKIFFNKGK